MNGALWQTIRARFRGNPFTRTNAARSILWLARCARAVARRVPALRRLHYRLRNAEAFDDLFWHDLMLADSVRQEAYSRAIEKHIHPGSVVADLGTGTGILACLAARRGAKVYAVEHARIIERARELAACNGLDNIEFVECHSREFRPPQKLDVILHEQIGMALVDEDMIENIVDWRDRLLKPGGLILPGRFSLFVDPVELREERRIPYIWEQRFRDLDFSSLKPRFAPWTSGGGYDKRALDPADVKLFLAHRNRVLEFDLHTLEPSALPNRWEFEACIDSPGRLDGFCLYFSVGFDDELGFETGPDSRPTSWGCRLLRSEARELRSGDQIHFSLRPVSITNAASWTWNYSVEVSDLQSFPQPIA